MNKNCIIFVLVVIGLGSLYFLFGRAQPKRKASPKIPPVRTEKLEIRVPNTPEAEGFIEAWTLDGKQRIWKQRVYRTLYLPLAEEDVQADFIKSMSLASENNMLTIVTERGRSYTVSIKPRPRWWNPALTLMTVLLIVSTLIVIRWRARSREKKG